MRFACRLSTQARMPVKRKSDNHDGVCPIFAQFGHCNVTRPHCPFTHPKNINNSNNNLHRGVGGGQGSGDRQSGINHTQRPHNERHFDGDDKSQRRNTEYRNTEPAGHDQSRSSSGNNRDSSSHHSDQSAQRRDLSRSSSSSSSGSGNSSSGIMSRQVDRSESQDLPSSGPQPNCSSSVGAYLAAPSTSMVVPTARTYRHARGSHRVT